MDVSKHTIYIIGMSHAVIFNRQTILKDGDKNMDIFPKISE